MRSENASCKNSGFSPEPGHSYPFITLAYLLCQKMWLYWKIFDGTKSIIPTNNQPKKHFLDLTHGGIHQVSTHQWGAYHEIGDDAVMDYKKFIPLPGRLRVTIARRRRPMCRPPCVSDSRMIRKGVSKVQVSCIHLCNRPLNTVKPTTSAHI